MRLGEALWRDTRHSVRSFAKSPGFIVVAVLSLALGIGLNTTVFSFVDALLLRPLPLVDADRLVQVVTTDEQNRTANFGVSRDNYVDLRDNNEVFERVTAIADFSLHVASGRGQPERVDAEIVTGNYFSTMGVSPLLGRGFLPDEDRVEGAKLVTVLGYALWQRRFGGDASILGQTILVNNQPFLVVGVMPAGFRGAHQIGGPELWVPFMTYPVTTSGATRAGIPSRRYAWFGVVGRLRPGVSVAQATASVTTIGRRLQRAYPNDNQGRGLAVRPLIALIPDDRGGVIASVALLLTAVGLVLFIACANVGNLLMSRALARQKEIAIRQSLGASRGQIFRQLLTEGLLLSLVAGVTATAVSLVAKLGVWQFRPAYLTVDALDLGADARLLGFATAVSLLACVLCSLAPVLTAARQDLATDLKEKGSGSGAAGRAATLRHFFVTVQVALCAVTLVGAGLFVRSLQAAQRMEPGFDVARLAGMRLDLGAQGYDEGRGNAFFERAVAEVKAIPGVRSAVFADLIPLFGGGAQRSVFLEGQAAGDGRNGRLVDTGVVGPGYFETVGVDLTTGRAFSETDRPSTRAVAIVNQTMARLFWPGQDPLGKRFRFIRGEYMEVIGVVGDTKYGSVSAEPSPVLYRALTQVYQPSVSLLVRSDRPAAVLPLVRARVQQLDPRLPITAVETLEDSLGELLWAPRLAAALLTLLGSISLVLAIIGIYGVMAYSVKQRTREFGVRQALGASRRDVLSLVLTQGSRLSLLGIVTGLGIAAAASRLVTGLIYSSTTDALTFIVAALILAVSALAATCLPAWRATRVEPVVALRELVP